MSRFGLMVSIFMVVVMCALIFWGGRWVYENAQIKSEVKTESYAEKLKNESYAEKVIREQNEMYLLERMKDAK